MIPELNYVIFNTGAGWIGILGSANGLQRITLPQPSPTEVRQLLGGIINNAVESPQLFHDLIERLNFYLEGRRVTFPDKLDFSGATGFQRQVWQATRRIPHGETRSYAWVAEQIKKPEAARAAGQALKRNPLPIIIPCHRVLASDGQPGGFAGGIEMKMRLLRMEGASI